MTKSIRFSIIFALLGCLSFLPAAAAQNFITNVTIIHASTGSNHVDGSLRSIASELQSVFKYTSYSLIKSQTLKQRSNQNSQVSLPGGRTLVVKPLEMKGRRIPYQINILKKNRSVFQTRIQLNNNSSVTIGGPQYKNGVLLFNIRGSAR